VFDEKFIRENIIADDVKKLSDAAAHLESAIYDHQSIPLWSAR